MRKRTCGECHVCCDFIAVESLAKPKNTPCPLLQACNGGCCSAYENRPSECATYKCSWLDGHVPADWRPDRSGLLFESGHIDWPHTIRLIHGFEVRPGAIAERRAMLRRIFHSGTVAIVVPFELTTEMDDEGSMLVRTGPSAVVGVPQRSTQRPGPAGSDLDGGQQTPAADGLPKPEWFGDPADVRDVRSFFTMCRASGSMTLRMADADDSRSQ